MYEFEAGGYAVDRVLQSICECGADVFHVTLDEDAGVAIRECVDCGVEVAMLDSEEFIDTAEDLFDATCFCDCTEFVIGVGFSLTDASEIRWVSIGLICTNDGVAGVYADWKIDYSPSTQLLQAL